jgi:hypothetical protein
MRSVSQSVFLQRGYFRNPSGSTILQAWVVAGDALPRPVFIGFQRVFGITLLFFEACGSALLRGIEAIDVHLVCERDIRAQLGAFVILAQRHQ